MQRDHLSPKTTLSILVSTTCIIVVCVYQLNSQTNPSQAYQNESTVTSLPSIHKKIPQPRSSSFIKRRPVRKKGANVIILGAPKCGTGALVHFLSQHSSVVSSRQWEPHFWDQGWNDNIDIARNLARYAGYFYKSNKVSFDIKSKVIQIKLDGLKETDFINTKIWVEKTPSYRKSRLGSVWKIVL